MISKTILVGAWTAIPHNSDETIGFLWNHEVPSDGDFTKPDTNAVLGAESLACLGCHDGQTAMDSFGPTPPTLQH